VCAYYSAELQLRVLHAEPASLLEPILDLGCGPAGTLVAYLRQQGLEAWGLDRAPSSAPHVQSGDWLESPLGSARWGTIISHMAFSNHFLREHLHPSGNPERYARRYMQVLGALKPAGSFLYAPGLPFLEQHLPAERYCVERSAVQDVAGSFVDQALRDRVGEAVLYACRVTRRDVSAAPAV